MPQSCKIGAIYLLEEGFKAMRITFLGTGAADWKTPAENGEFRRFTSTLVDTSLLLDVTPAPLALLPADSRVQDVFITHSHRDHFSPEALASLAPCRVYIHESWAGEVCLPGVTVIPLRVGEWVSIPTGYRVLPLPANHSTSRPYETPLHYLIEKDGTRLLYATDGAWMLNRAHHLLADVRLDGAVFDATIGDGFPGDYRVFEHNSLDMVRLMHKTLVKTGRLAPDTSVFLTHLARTLHPDQRTLEASLQPPFVPCYDGFEANI